MPKIPRPEYPRPEMVRPDWANLNGYWGFDFDHGASGMEEGWQEGHRYPGRILVPFAPESGLSGIADRDFHPAVWYERDIRVPALKGKRMLVHFGASDYETTVFLNGRGLGSHAGGYTPFSFDITPFARKGKNRLTVCARDDVRSRIQPAGKQSEEKESYGCSYTRTTGIWQTVWAEIVPVCYVSRVAAVPGWGLESVRVDIETAGKAEGALAARVDVKAGKRTVASAEERFGGMTCAVEVPVRGARRWSPDDPFLYDVEVTLKRRGRAIDTVKSYFGMRSVELTEREFLLNGAPVYLRLVLDQGFYPTGVYTAPSDGALKKDIRISLDAGFNGARLHQKVFEPRFLYWADRMGYLCWGEAPDWKADLANRVAQNSLLAEWTEVIRRDSMHPSIIAWVATNEQHPGRGRRGAKGEYLARLYRTLGTLDPTRPVIDNSGYWHTETDIVDIHDYTDGKGIRRNWKKFSKTGKLADIPEVHCPPFWPGWSGVNAPVHLSEVGGIGFVAGGAKGWGYGGVPKTKKEFMNRLEKTMKAITSLEHVCGYCYTQLYDIEQEINGLYTYSRKTKFDIRALRRIFRGR